MGEARIRKEKHKLLNSRAACKNCGENDTFLREYEKNYVVECLECYSSTPPMDSDVGAVKAWNEGKVQ